MLTEPLDMHTRRALIEASRDLSTAAERAIERAIDDTDGRDLDRVLAVYDAIDSAIRAVSRL
jgi:hypothetical protein